MYSSDSSLQNLAWLDSEGNVHTVNDQNGRLVLGAGRPQMLGAHAPSLQNLAWLGPDGKVHTVQENGQNAGLLGAGRPPMIGSHAPSLENLAWLGEDGKVHTVNDNGKNTGLLGAGRPPMLGAHAPRLENLAWLGEDGKVHTVQEHGQNAGLLGAGRPPMLGAHHQLMNLEATEVPSNNLDIDLGTTEYVLIGMWFAFTIGVFSLLYKITKEADKEVEENKKKIRTQGAVQNSYEAVGLV